MKDRDSPNDPANIAWSQQRFRMMAEGGTWGIPRSGLIFRKEDGKLVLVNRIPWMTGMSMTPEQLRDYQQEDFDCINRHFKAAGITVVSSL